MSQIFLCHFIQKTTPTFKEKYFIYDVGKEGDPHPPAKPAPPAAPAAAPAPAEGTAKPEAAGEKPAEAEKPAAEENPKALFEALKQKVTSLSQTIDQVVGNETYTKGLQAEAQSAKAALAKIQTQMDSIKIDEVDMAKVEGFKAALTAIEGDKFQGEKANENIATKEKITKLRAALKQISQESYNAEKVKEAILKTLPAEFPQVVKDAIIARLDNAKVGDLIEADLKILQDMLDNADSETDLETINQRITQVEDEIPTLTIESFIENSPEMVTIGKQIATVLIAGALTTVIATKSDTSLTEEEKTKRTDQIYAKAANLIINGNNPDAEEEPAEEEPSEEEPSEEEPPEEETPEAAQLRKKELIDKAQAILDRFAPVVNDTNYQTYTKGLVDKVISSDLNIPQAKLAAENPPTEATMASLEAQIKAVEEDPAFTAEAIAANEAAKEQIKALGEKITEKEADMTPDQAKTAIFQKYNISEFPEPLQEALKAKFPIEEMTKNLSEKFTTAKAKLDSADKLFDPAAIEAEIALACEELNKLSTIDDYLNEPIFEQFNAASNQADYIWGDIKDLGLPYNTEGEQCKAAKAEVLASLVKAIEGDDGSYPGLAESEHKILAAYLADFVSEKIGQKITPQQITGALMTFSRLTNPKAADKTTKAIIEALQSPELQGKVQFNWKAYTNATPHDVDKSLAEHQKLLNGLDEAEKRSAAGTLSVDDGDIAPPETDAEGKPVEGYRPGKIDAELVSGYRKCVEDAAAQKPGTKGYRDAIKALNTFVKENKNALCRAGGHFDLATGVIRAGEMRKAVVGDQKEPDLTNETVYIKITDRKEDIGKSNLKAAGLYFSAPVPPEMEGEEPAVPAEGQPVADDKPAAADQPATGDQPATADTPVAEETLAKPAPAAPAPAGEEPAATVAGTPSQPAPAPVGTPPGGAAADKVPTPVPNPEGAADEVPAPVPNPGDASKDTHDGEEPAPLLDDFSAEKHEIDKVKIWYTKGKVQYSSKEAITNPKEGDLMHQKDTNNPGHYFYSRFFMNKWQPMGSINYAPAPTAEPEKMPDGEGERTLSDGTVEKGTFANDKLVKGTRTLPGGEIDKGIFDPVTGHLSKVLTN